MNLTTPITTKTTTTTTTTATATVVCLQHNPSLMPGRILQDVAAGVVIHVLVYPLVTDDPNMIEKKQRNLQNVSSGREKHKFLLKTVHTVPGCVLLCAVPDQLGPFSQLINF